MDDLKNIAPELSKIKKEVPFKTPDNYFDDFSARLRSKIGEEKKVIPVRKNPFIRYLKPALGLAASFALIFLLVYWPLKTFMPERMAESGSQPDLIEMEFLNMTESIDENSFYALLENSNGSDEFTDEELVIYLSDNMSEYDLYAGADINN